MTKPGGTIRLSPAAVASLALAAITVAIAARDTATRFSAIWTTRNVVAWEVARFLPPDPLPTTAATLRGTVRDAAGRPVAGATALVPLPDGTTLEARTAPDGTWAIRGVPTGRRPAWVGAPGMAPVVVEVDVPGTGGDAPKIDVTLVPAARPANADPAPARDRASELVREGAGTSWTCDRPIPAAAVRSEVLAPRVGLGPGQAIRYRPDPDAARHDPGLLRGPGREDAPPNAADAIGGPDGSARPPLLVVYPGPAASWECASIPLAAAGFEVVAYGPPYGFDIEGEIDHLRLLMATLGERPAVLAGSYSAIHALRLVQDAPPGTVRGVVLMGPPVDLFDLRRRLEVEGWVPPFGLDRALVALGTPDREVARHARYSARLHVASSHPPTLVIHSRSDEVVPIAQGEAYLRALAEAGVVGEGMFLDGGGHYLLSSGGEAEAILARTVAFLAQR